MGVGSVQVSVFQWNAFKGLIVVMIVSLDSPASSLGNKHCAAKFERNYN